MSMPQRIFSGLGKPAAPVRRRKPPNRQPDRSGRRFLPVSRRGVGRKESPSFPLSRRAKREGGDVVHQNLFVVQREACANSRDPPSYRHSGSSQAASFPWQGLHLRTISLSPSLTIRLLSGGLPERSWLEHVLEQIPECLPMTDLCLPRQNMQGEGRKKRLLVAIIFAMFPYRVATDDQEIPGALQSITKKASPPDSFHPGFPPVRKAGWKESQHKKGEHSLIF